MDTMTPMMFQGLGWMMATSQTPEIPWIEQFISPWMKDEFIGMEYWRWGAIVFVVAIGLTIDIIVRFVLRHILRSITQPEENDTELTQILKTVPRPAGVAAGGVVWLALLPLLDLPEGVLLVVEPTVHIYITLACIWFGFKGTDLIAWVANQKAKKTKNKLDDLLVPLLRKTLKAFVIVFGIVYLAILFANRGAVQNT